MGALAINGLISTINGAKYSTVDQVKFVLEADHTTLIFLKAVFHKFYLVHNALYQITINKRP